MECITNYAEIRVPARAYYAKLARELVAGVGIGKEVPEDVIYEIKLAVTEAFANVVKHAYPTNGLSNGYVKIKCLVNDNDFIVKVSDKGKGFDPDKCIQNEMPTPENLKEGGLGLFIITRLMDDVKFDCNHGRGSSIRMIKKIS